MSTAKPLYLSLSCIPLPVFIEGGVAYFKPGERHPNRNDLPFFILVIMKKGRMFLAEEKRKFIVKPHEMFIFLPDRHHYSFQACDEDSEYYWLHFLCVGRWQQDEKPAEQQSVIKIPTLHYHTTNHTVYLAKHRRLSNIPEIFATAEKLLHSTNESESFSFWQVQELFLDLLQYVQLPAVQESSVTKIALKVERYLRDHFDMKITNTNLAQQFHIHPNYIGRCMKQTIGITPMKYLNQVRIEEAKKRLLNTTLSIKQIADQCGFQNVYYFSNLFKKVIGMPPMHYREINGITKDDD
ncbi:helix-turn-helix transcriptional regulator [Sporolactobacillus sp. KGMB 08714]|uniref:helix-turn-helix transcriptional regulator n=1 Tax=Sporolactobacillus sp. KGMB 08714 TaxID=3064704 RepID=UPI002FBD3417